jgi:hypothetical protein
MLGHMTLGILLQSILRISFGRNLWGKYNVSSFILSYYGF